MQTYREWLDQQLDQQRRDNKMAASTVTGKGRIIAAEHDYLDAYRKPHDKLYEIKKEEKLQPTDKKDHAYKQGTALSYQGVLDHISNCLYRRRLAGNDDDYERALRYEKEAETLIELLEVHNCGSSGGFDKGQWERSLEDRWRWLESKETRTKTKILDVDNIVNDIAAKLKTKVIEEMEIENTLENVK